MGLSLGAVRRWLECTARKRKRALDHESVTCFCCWPPAALEHLQAGDVKAAKSSYTQLARALGCDEDSSTLEPLRTLLHLQVCLSIGILHLDPHSLALSSAPHP